jgi:hypothetical protein
MSVALAGLLLLLSLEALPEETLATITFLVVSGDSGWEPSINNAGEIVYLARDGAGNPNVVSNRRGQLTHSTTGHLRFPELNDSGEVVYADRVPPAEEFQVWSTERGLLTVGTSANTPAIGDSGEVCFVRSAPGEVEIHTDRRGRVLDLGDSVATTCDINAQGEIVFRGLDDKGNFQIFSTTRSQLTNEENVLLGTPSVNNRGEVVWVQSGELFSLAQGQLTEFGGLVGFRVDLNDRGDVVFPYRLKKTFIVVLATRNPERYPELPPLQYETVRSPDFEVAVIVDPRGNPGVVVLGSRDVLPVAILSSSVSQGEALDFDASQVDVLSVRLGPKRASIGVRSMSEISDVDGDGDDDLLLFFRRGKVGFGCGDTNVALEGRTTVGKAFQGFAPVLISGCE